MPGLFFLPHRYFQHTAFDYTIVLLNILMVGMAIYMTGQATTDFYLFFFIILMMSAAGQSLQAFVLGVITASGLYLLMVYRTGDFEATEGFLLRIPFCSLWGSSLDIWSLFKRRDGTRSRLSLNSRSIFLNSGKPWFKLTI